MWDLRGDQNFSDKDKLFLRYSYYKLYVYNPGPLPIPLVGSISFQQSINNQSGHQRTGCWARRTYSRRRWSTIVPQGGL